MLAADIGRAVAGARARLGMSLEEVSTNASLRPELLASIERGEALVSTAKLDRIASTLGLDAFALYEGREVDRGLVMLPRHAARPDFHYDDLPVLRRALERAAALNDVHRMLGRHALTFPPAAPGDHPEQDGYHRARLVRRALQRITEPLHQLQVLLAQSFHIPVIYEPLATGALQAATVRSPAVSASAIVISTAASGAPKQGTPQAWLVNRVSICHELCHALFDEPRDGGVQIVLDDDAGERSPVEKRAGAFAAELLIPLHGLKKRFGDEGQQVDSPARADSMVDDVRAHFGTPAEIAVNHLYNHGYVAKISKFREEMIERAAARNVPTPSPELADDFDAWRRSLLSVTREAHNGSLISDGAARALLELDAGDPLPWERDAP